MNLIAKTYQNIRKMSSVVRGYVDKLVNFQGVRWGCVSIKGNQILGRELILAIPPGASEAQRMALAELERWALDQGVTLIIEVIE